MGSEPSPRSTRFVWMAGLAIAAAIGLTLVLRPSIVPDDGLATADDLAAWIAEHPEHASVLVWDLDTGEDLVSSSADRARAVAGVTAVLLAAEYARQAEGGLDTTYRIPGSTLDRRVLPRVEALPPDLGAVALPDLVRAAVHGHRPAADELIRILGRDGVESVPGRLGATLDAPLPVGGLQLAWAPVQWRSGTTPGEQAARFARIARTAQRDSAFARDLAYLSSAAYRAGETTRLESPGWGLTDAEIHEVAASSFPRGTARGYADLLTRAAEGSLLSAAVSSRVLHHLGPDSLRTARGAAAGLASAAVLVRTSGGRRGAVLLLERLPVEGDAQPLHARLAAELAARWARQPETWTALQDE